MPRKAAVSKTAHKLAAKPAHQPVIKPAKAASPSAKPFLRFYHSDALRAKTLAVLSTVEDASDATKHRGALGDVIVELTDGGMDYYFMRPLKVAKAGFFIEQTANLGMATAKKVFASVVRNIIGRMDPPQLVSVCGSIRQLMK